MNDASAKAITQKSKLTPAQQKLVCTPAFISWFGNWQHAFHTGDYSNCSRVIDKETGEPLVVYHGTMERFHSFKLTEERNGRLFGDGFYFSDNENLSREFGFNVMQVFLNIRRPYLLHGEYAIFDLADMDNIRLDLLAKGYDGIIATGRKFGGSTKFPAVYIGFTEMVAFHDFQIKLADGSNTNFNAMSKDIRFAKGGSVGGVVSWMGVEKENNMPLAFTGDGYQIFAYDHGGKIGLKVVTPTGEAIYPEHSRNGDIGGVDHLPRTVRKQVKHIFREESTELFSEGGVVRKVPKDFDSDFDFTWGKKYKTTGEIVVAHSTSSALLGMIAQHGLKVNQVSVWEDTTPGKLYFELEPTYTHYGDNVYAWKACQKYGGVPVTLYVKVRQSDLHVDRDDNALGTRYQKNQKEYYKDVPPENILGARFIMIDIKREDFEEFSNLWDKEYKEGGVVENPYVQAFQKRITEAQHLKQSLKDSYGTNLKINGNGSITLYHATSEANAEKIREHGFKPGTFFFASKTGNFNGDSVSNYVKKHKDACIMEVQVNPVDISFSSGTGEFYATSALTNEHGYFESTSENKFAEGGAVLSQSTHVRDTLLDKDIINSLSEQKRIRILSLLDVYNKSGYIDARTQLGPDQVRRMSEKQRDQISATAAKVFRIENEIKELLKSDDQLSREAIEKERRELEAQKGQKENYIKLLRNVYRKKLESPKDNNVKRTLALEEHQLDRIEVRLGELSEKQHRKFEEGGSVQENEVPKKSGSSYEERVQSNMRFMNSSLSDWRAVPIIGFQKTENDKGVTVEMPLFDFPKEYSKAPSLYPVNTSGDANCELCGKMPIKRIFWIQNDTTRQTLCVGSECVGYVGEGRSGKENLRQFKLTMAKILDQDMMNLAELVFANYSKVVSIGYGRKERRWDSSYVGRGQSSPYWEKLYAGLEQLKPSVVFDEKKLNRSSKDHIYWKFVYDMIPRFHYESSLKMARTYNETPESVDKKLLAWFTKNEKLSVQILREVPALITLLHEKTDYSSDYLQALSHVPETFSEGGEVTKSDSFKKWFAHSKVVDEKGDPLIVYHGTASKFDEFRRDMIGKNYGSTFGRGFYFTELPENATGYKKMVPDSSASPVRTIMQVYLSLQHPLEVTSVTQYREIVQKERARRGTNKVEQERLLIKDDADILADMGYDGVIFRHGGKMNEIVAFQPTQIKSATDNNGSFDPDSHNILFSEGGSVDQKTTFEQFCEQQDRPDPEYIQELETAIVTLQAKYDKISNTKTYSDRLAQAFPGARVGFQTHALKKIRDRDIEKTIDRAKTSIQIRDQIQHLEQRLKAYRAGKVNKNGQPKVPTIERLTALVATCDKAIESGSLSGKTLSTEEMQNLKDQRKSWNSQLQTKKKDYRKKYDQYLQQS
jgi:hypothetical protein